MATTIGIRMLFRSITRNPTLSSRLKLFELKRRINTEMSSVILWSVRQVNTAGGMHSSTTRQLRRRAQHALLEVDRAR